MSKQRFELGKVFISKKCLQHCRSNHVSFANLLAKHASCNWGTVGRHVVATNERSISGKENFRLMSSYLVGDRNIWIVTSRLDGQGKRESTAIFLPSEALNANKR
jgi:hypothetical protein